MLILIVAIINRWGNNNDKTMPVVIIDIVQILYT